MLKQSLLLLLFLIPITAFGQVSEDQFTDFDDNYFAGGAKLTASGNGSLSDVLQDIMSKAARDRVASATFNWANSTGHNPALDFTLVAQSASLPGFTETGTASATKDEFDSAIYGIATTQKTIAANINLWATPMGIAAIDISNITTVSVSSLAGIEGGTATIPAVSTSITAGSSSLVDATTANDRLATIQRNNRVLALMANRVSKALGGSTLTDNIGGTVFHNRTTDQFYLTNIDTTGSSNSGTNLSTIRNASVNTELTAIGKNLATISKFMDNWTRRVVPNFVPSSVGVASTTDYIAPINLIAAFTHVAATTDSVGIAEATPILIIIENNISDLVDRVGIFKQRNGLYLLTDNNSSVQPNGGLEDVGTTAGVVGAGTGNDMLTVADATAFVHSTRNNIATLVLHTNQIASKYGIAKLTDDSGGTASSLTIEDVSIPVAADAGDGSSDTAVSFTAFNIILTQIENAMGTIEHKLREITNADTKWGTIPEYAPQ